MSKHFSSIAEAKADAIFTALGCIRCESFLPYFPDLFKDANGDEFKALPDYYHPATNTFFEYKTCALNGKKSFKTADNKLRAQYRHNIGPDTGLTYAQVSAATWAAKYRNDCLLHAWNHALAKQLAVQKTLGTENFVVIFGNTLDAKEALKYEKKGLAFLPLAKLEAFLTA